MRNEQEALYRFARQIEELWVARELLNQANKTRARVEETMGGL